MRDWWRRHSELLEFAGLTMGPPLAVLLLTHNVLIVAIAALAGLVAWVSRNA